MRALIDGDILRYELGFAAETGWKGITEGREKVPTFDYVEHLIEDRIDQILRKTGASSYQIYLTEGPTFRYDIAVTQPYKANRDKEAKPWHFDNLTAYFTGVLGAEVVRNIEADDRLSIEHVKDAETIVCSRDKDLRQVPGWFYSWELWRQPEFGPVDIDKWGSLSLDGFKLSGTGLAFFYAQCLMGDRSDTIPGLPKWGPVKTFCVLNDNPEPLDTIQDEYYDHYGSEWEDKLLEQGRLLWMTRRLHEDGSPVLWEIGMEE